MADEGMLDMLEQLPGLDEAGRRLIAGGNAGRVLGLAAPAVSP